MFQNSMKEEAALIYLVYEELYRRHKIKSEDVGIIAPYLAQVDHIRNFFKKYTHNNIPEISSVDIYQGREKKIIIICFVRSNENKNIGFLKEERRINVSITKAQKKLVIIGDSSTIEVDPYIGFALEMINIKAAFNSIEKRDAYRYYNTREKLSYKEKNIIKKFGHKLSEKEILKLKKEKKIHFKNLFSKKIKYQENFRVNQLVNKINQKLKKKNEEKRLIEKGLKKQELIEEKLLRRQKLKKTKSLKKKKLKEKILKEQRNNNKV